MRAQQGIFKMYLRERSNAPRRANGAADLGTDTQKLKCNVLKLEALDAWREENRVGYGRDRPIPQTAPPRPTMPGQYAGEWKLCNYPE